MGEGGAPSPRTMAGEGWARGAAGEWAGGDLLYRPGFVGEADAERLLQGVRDVPQSRWRVVSGRRLQNWGGRVERGRLVQEALPGWLVPLLTSVRAALPAAFPEKLNHVLVNQYLRGEGILPHEDGPSYSPHVAILSLGGPAVLRFHEKGPAGEGQAQAKLALSVLLEPRSLVLFQGALYSDCLHSIDFVEEDRLDASVVNLEGSLAGGGGGSVPRGVERVSLTMRRVLKTGNRFVRL